MPKQRKPKKVKVTAYYDPKEHGQVSKKLKAENKSLGLIENDRKSPKAAKTHSDLLVVLSMIWKASTLMQDAVREVWVHQKKIEKNKG